MKFRFSPTNTVWLLVVAICAVGIFARVYQYQNHFAPYDDLGVPKSIFDARQRGDFGLFAVPTQWNYSPFQFLITPSLISLDDSYRQMLALGRLPSVIASILGLIFFIVFYWRYNAMRSWEGVVALVLVVSSLEYIIFSKQMHNYALGVTAVILLMLVLVDCLKRQELSWGRMILAGAFLGVLSTMQYSVLFFIPAFFGAITIDRLWRLPKRVSDFLKIGAAAGVFVITFFPVWFYFLRDQVVRGNVGISNWNRGENLEFFFQLPQGNIWSKISYAIAFFIQNSFLVLQNNTAFLPEGHAWALPVGMIFFILFFVGIFSFITSTPAFKKSIGVFTILVIMTWIGLVCLQKLTLSPTRHNLILLPLLAMDIAEGFALTMTVIGKFSRRENLEQTGMVTAGILIIGTFCLYYPQFCRERYDPFNEEAIVSKLKEYNVDALIPALWTLQAEFMPAVRTLYNYNGARFIQGFKSYDILVRGPSNYRRIAWLSRRQPLTRLSFNEAQNMINVYLMGSNPLRIKRGVVPLSLLREPFGAYRVIYQDVRHSNREIEYSSLTRSDTNGFYFYILEHK